MDIHKIQIPAWLLQKLEIQPSYKSKQEAINALKESLAKHEFQFTIEEDGNKTRFVNESGGEMALVVPA